MPIKLAPKVLEKTPSEVKAFSFDFEDDLNTGDSVSTLSSIAVSPSGPGISNSSVSGNLAQATISGGTAGVEYLFTCTVNTANGEVLQGTGLLRVQNP